MNELAQQAAQSTAREAEAAELRRVYAIQATNQNQDQINKIQNTEGALMAAECAMRDQAQMLAIAENEQKRLRQDRDTLAQIAQEKSSALQQGESKYEG